MTPSRILDHMDGVRVGVVGDFCLDGYWTADMRLSELSRETPRFPLPIVEERYSPGAAGNVALNVAALRPLSVQAFGVVGADWRGSLLRHLLQEKGVDCAGLLEDDTRMTNAYLKPLRIGFGDEVQEDPRLDFENRAPISPRTEEALIAAIRAAKVDVLCVCDQMKQGCITPAVREELSRLGREGLLIIADSRDNAALFRHVILKPNEIEAVRAFPGHTSFEATAAAISAHTGCPALVTLGDKGCLVHEKGETTEVPAFQVPPPVDICGAGDSFLSGLACALAAGASLRDAAQLGCAASAVTIRKLRTTGTATREEILRVIH